MRTRMISILILLAAILHPSQGQAFDGERQGFFIGLGAGAGSVDELSGDDLGFVTSFKIGGGPSNHVLVYGSNRVIYINGSYLGMSALGASYFLRPSGHSLFIAGEVGLTAYNSRTGFRTGPNGSYSNIGFTLGIGYQLPVDLLLEADYMQASMESGTELKIYTLTLSFFAF